MTDGSSLESEIELEELLGGFCPYHPPKLLRCCSSTARLLRLLKKKNSPPAIAVRATRPTTTPAAIPATFGPFFVAIEVVVMTVVVGCVCPGAVTTTVDAWVTTDGSDAFVVVGAAAAADDGSVSGDADWVSELESVLDAALEPELDPEPDTLPGLELVPVSCTEKVLDPPPGNNVSIERIKTMDIMNVHII